MRNMLHQPQGAGLVLERFADPRPPQRRGVAMLLVLVTVGVATVAATAYISSRSNTPMIADNVADEIQSRLSAETGIDLAVAVMECETLDWRTAHDNGVLIHDYDFGHGRLTVTLSDYEGNVPSDESEFVVVSSTGLTNGIAQVIEADVFSPRKHTGIDVDLSEFAVFGHESIRVDSASLLRWEASPRAALGEPVRIGTNNLSAGSIEVRDGSAVVGGVAYVQERASESVVAASGNLGGRVRRVDVTVDEAIPVPDVPEPRLQDLLWATTRSPWITQTSTRTISDDQRYESLRIGGGATFTTNFTGHNVFAIDGNVEVTNNATWIVNGEADIVIRGDLLVDSRAAIVLGEDSKLRLFIGGSLMVEHGFIGFTRDELAVMQSASMPVVYRNPENCQIFKLRRLQSSGLDNLLDLGDTLDNADVWSWADDSVREWEISDHGVVCAQIYGGRWADIELDENAVVCGSICGRQVEIRDGSRVFYDPTLDLRLGYSEPTSALFDGPKSLQDNIQTLVQNIANEAVSLLEALLGADDDAPPAVGAGEPTPRDEARVKSKRIRKFGAKPKSDGRDENDD